MAVGNQVGKIFVWDMITEHASKPYLTLQHTKMTAQCRQCSFSPSGGHLVAVFDDATVWRFDFQQTGGSGGSVSTVVKDLTPPVTNGDATPKPNGEVKDEPEEKPVEPKEEPQDPPPGGADDDVLPALEPMEVVPNGHT